MMILARFSLSLVLFGVIVWTADRAISAHLANSQNETVPREHSEQISLVLDPAVPSVQPKLLDKSILVSVTSSSALPPKLAVDRVYKGLLHKLRAWEAARSGRWWFRSSDHDFFTQPFVFHFSNMSIAGLVRMPEHFDDVLFAERDDLQRLQVSDDAYVVVAYKNPVTGRTDVSVNILRDGWQASVVGDRDLAHLVPNIVSAIPISRPILE